MQSRLQGCWSGVRRGAKFGAIAGIVIWTILIVVMLVISLVVPTIREHAVADLKKDWERWGPFSAIGSLFATFGLMAIYGAAGGIFVMGIAGFVRGTRAEPTAIDETMRETVK